MSDLTKAEILKLIEDRIEAAARDKRYSTAYTNITHNGIDGPILSYLPLNKSFLCVAAATNGTTAVNVFTTFGSPVIGVITGVFVIAQDTTAGNITLKNAGSTVVVVAKGTVTGAMTGGVSLANTALKKGGSVTIVSSSAGNATVFMVYSVTA